MVTSEKIENNLRIVNFSIEAFQDEWDEMSDIEKADFSYVWSADIGSFVKILRPAYQNQEMNPEQEERYQKIQQYLIANKSRIDKEMLRNIS